MAQTAIQLYTLRDVDQPLPAVLEAVGETSFNGVEFAHRVTEGTLSPVLEALEKTDLDVAGAHVDLEALETDLEATLERYRRLGCDRLVVPYLDDSHFESPAAVAKTADRLTEAATAVNDAGFTLHYHNHEHEFVDCDGTPAMERLLEETDDRVGFELDAGWAAVGGSDPVSLLEEYGDRISLVHVADVDLEAGESTEVGNGDLDLETLSHALRQAAVEWYIYEYDTPAEPLESLVTGSEVLETMTR